jgi:pyruvate kinase
MLNKGAHVVEAVGVLDDILRRMEGHQAKKRARMRPLALAQRFAAGGNGEEPAAKREGLATEAIQR